MNSQKIIKELHDKYPGKRIILNPPDNPTEIICEIEPTEEHPEKDVALAIVDRSEPHYHKKSTEIYEIIKGTLTVYKDGKKYVVQKGDKLTIEPNVVHYVEGDEVWLLAYSTPGWTLEDHILVIDNKEMSRKKYDKGS